jgi:hypothetical protein
MADFGITKDYKYVTLRRIINYEMSIPAGFEFDGVTVKAPFTFIFSNKNLRQGIRASCFHDWMCLDKKTFGRREATEILVSMWCADGLSPFKGWVVSIFVNAFQRLKGWR